VYTARAVSPTIHYLLESLVGLAVLSLAAVALVVWARRNGVAAKPGPMELLGRLPLDARRAVYLVRVGDTALVLGTGDGGGLCKLGEIPIASLPPGARAIESPLVLPFLRRAVAAETSSETAEPTRDVAS
jgi:flagellar biogenesis protein FliO